MIDAADDVKIDKVVTMLHEVSSLAGVVDTLNKLKVDIEKY